jgi:hypothetical protein
MAKHFRSMSLMSIGAATLYRILTKRTQQSTKIIKLHNQVVIFPGGQ